MRVFAGREKADAFEILATLGDGDSEDASRVPAIAAGVAEVDVEERAGRVGRKLPSGGKALGLAKREEALQRRAANAAGVDADDRPPAAISRRRG